MVVVQITRRQTGIAQIDFTHVQILGSDEVAYGNWAGPLIVVAVCAPLDWDDPDVTDSKALKDKQRRALKAKYENDPRFTISSVLVEPEEIDSLGVYNALLWAHAEAIRRSLAKLKDIGLTRPLIVIDGNLPIKRLGLDAELTIMTLPKADLKVPEVGLASCIAKTLQVDAMQALDKQYPGYGFLANKGYGTPQHQVALNRLGSCPAHRKSYAPVKKVLSHLNAAKEAWAHLEDTL